MTEIDKLLIQIEENRQRKDLTPAEIYQAGQKLERLMATPKGRPKKGENCPIFGKGKTREKVAAALGVSGKQYEKIREIHKSPHADLKEELERHGKVDRVHKKILRRNRAKEVAKDIGTVPLTKVICADCLDYLRGKEPFAHASVFDPPFGIGFRYGEEKELTDNPKDYWEWFRPRYEEIRRVTLPGGAIIFWQADKYRRYWYDWFGDHQLFFAVKTNCGPYLTHKGPMTNATDLILFQWKEGAAPLLPCRQDWSYDYLSTTLTFSDNLLHPCPRPLDLCEVIIRNWTIENGIILDAFAGSGQIPLAVKRVGGGLRSVAIEIRPDYAQEAEGRLAEAIPETNARETKLETNDILTSHPLQSEKVRIEKRR